MITPRQGPPGPGCRTRRTEDRSAYPIRLRPADPRRLENRAAERSPCGRPASERAPPRSAGTSRLCARLGIWALLLVLLQVVDGLRQHFNVVIDMANSRVTIATEQCAETVGYVTIV